MDDLDMSLDDLAQKNKPQRQQQQKPRGGGGRPGGVARTASGTAGGGPAGDRSGTRSPYARPPPASSDAPWKHDMFGGSRSAPGSGTHTPRSGGARFDPDRPTERPTARLRIDNVHYEIQPFQLEKIFAQAGELVDGPKIIYDRAGRSTGLAFVTYGSVADATLAKDKLDGQRANGEPIQISYVPVPLPRKTSGRTDALGRAVGPAADNAGKPLLGRLGGILGSGPTTTTTTAERERGGAPRQERERGGAAPARGAVGRGGGAVRGGARGGANNAGGGGRGGKREVREPRKAPTGDALDEELEAFMRAPPAAASATKASDAMEE